MAQRPHDPQLRLTSELDRAVLDAVRSLLFDVFDDMEEDDFEHTLGGVHALAFDGQELVGHAALVMRRLLHGGRALRCGYVEGVAVRASHRRRGIGAALMAPLESAIRSAYDLGALGSTDEALPFYAARGWVPWPGPLTALTPAGIVATTEEQGGVLVLRAAAALDPAGGLTADFRDGDLW